MLTSNNNGAFVPSHPSEQLRRVGYSTVVDCRLPSAAVCFSHHMGNYICEAQPNDLVLFMVSGEHVCEVDRIVSIGVVTALLLLPFQQEEGSQLYDDVWIMACTRQNTVKIIQFSRSSDDALLRVVKSSTHCGARRPDLSQAQVLPVSSFSCILMTPFWMVFLLRYTAKHGCCDIVQLDTKGVFTNGLWDHKLFKPCYLGRMGCVYFWLLARHGQEYGAPFGVKLMQFRLEENSLSFKDSLSNSKKRKMPHGSSVDIRSVVFHDVPISHTAVLQQPGRESLVMTATSSKELGYVCVASQQAAAVFSFNLSSAPYARFEAWLQFRSASSDGKDPGRIRVPRITDMVFSEERKLVVVCSEGGLLLAQIAHERETAAIDCRLCVSPASCIEATIGGMLDSLIVVYTKFGRKMFFPVKDKDGLEYYEVGLQTHRNALKGRVAPDSLICVEGSTGNTLFGIVNGELAALKRVHRCEVLSQQKGLENISQLFCVDIPKSGTTLIVVSSPQVTRLFRMSSDRVIEEVEPPAWTTRSPSGGETITGGALSASVMAHVTVHDVCFVDIPTLSHLCAWHPPMNGKISVARVSPVGVFVCWISSHLLWSVVRLQWDDMHKNFTCVLIEEGQQLDSEVSMISVEEKRDGSIVLLLGHRNCHLRCIVLQDKASAPFPVCHDALLPAIPGDACLFPSSRFPERILVGLRDGRFCSINGNQREQCIYSGNRPGSFRRTSNGTLLLLSDVCNVVKVQNAADGTEKFVISELDNHGREIDLLEVLCLQSPRKSLLLTYHDNELSVVCLDEGFLTESFIWSPVLGLDLSGIRCICQEPLSRACLLITETGTARVLFPQDKPLAVSEDITWKAISIELDKEFATQCQVTAASRAWFDPSITCGYWLLIARDRGHIVNVVAACNNWTVTVRPLTPRAGPSDGDISCVVAFPSEKDRFFLATPTKLLACRLLEKSTYILHDVAVNWKKRYLRLRASQTSQSLFAVGPGMPVLEYPHSSISDCIPVLDYALFYPGENRVEAKASILPGGCVLMESEGRFAALALDHGVKRVTPSSDGQTLFLVDEDGVLIACTILSAPTYDTLRAFQKTFQRMEQRRLQALVPCVDEEVVHVATNADCARAWLWSCNSGVDAGADPSLLSQAVSTITDLVCSVAVCANHRVSLLEQ